MFNSRRKKIGVQKKRSLLVCVPEQKLLAGLNETFCRKNRPEKVGRRHFCPLLMKGLRQCIYVSIVFKLYSSVKGVSTGIRRGNSLQKKPKWMKYIKRKTVKVWRIKQVLFQVCLVADENPALMGKVFHVTSLVQLRRCGIRISTLLPSSDDMKIWR